MPLPINRKLNVVEVDRHHEINILKAELRATGVQVNTRDEERDRRIENLLVIVAVSAATFFISNVGVFRGLLLTAFCLAMFCITYAKAFLLFTGGTNIPLSLDERLDTALSKIKEWIRLITDDLRDPQNRD
jgi:hypothetical protein